MPAKQNTRHMIAAFAAAMLLPGGTPVAIGAPAASPPGISIKAGLNDSPPLALITENDAFEGVWVDMAQKLFQRSGLQVELSIFPLPRLLKNLQEHTLDFSMLVRVPALEACCLFSKTPAITHILRLYRIGDTPAIEEKESLAGKSIIVQRSYSYAGLLDFIRDEKRRNRIEVAKSLAAGFEMLQNGRADYLLAYDANALEFLGKKPLPGLKSVEIGQYPVFLVLSKSFPDAEKTMLRLEDALNRIKHEN